MTANRIDIKSVH